MQSIECHSFNVWQYLQECRKGQYVEKIQWKYQGRTYGMIDFRMKCSGDLFWQRPVIGNPDGSWDRYMNCADKGFKLLRGREDGWPGIVNVEAKCVDGETTLNSNDDLRGEYNRDLKCSFPGARMVGIQIRQKTHHGITNFRVLCA